MEFVSVEEVLEWAKAVSSSDKEGEAGLLAGKSESLAAKLRAGGISGLTRIDLAKNVSAAIKAGNEDIPDDLMSRWRPLADKFNAKANGFYKEGKLTEAAHWAKLFEESAKGLRAIRGSAGC